MVQTSADAHAHRAAISPDITRLLYFSCEPRGVRKEAQREEEEENAREDLTDGTFPCISGGHSLSGIGLRRTCSLG